MPIQRFVDPSLGAGGDACVGGDCDAEGAGAPGVAGVGAAEAPGAAAEGKGGGPEAGARVVGGGGRGRGAPSTVTLTAVSSVPEPSVASKTMVGCAFSAASSHGAQSLWTTAGHPAAAQMRNCARA